MTLAAFHLPPLLSKLVRRSEKVVGFLSKDVGFRSKDVFLNRFLIDYDAIHARTIKEKKPKEKQPLAAFPFATTSIVRALRRQGNGSFVLRKRKIKRTVPLF